MPPVVVSLFGAQFITWRGIPIIPSDKVPVEKGKTKIILVRTGEERQGVVGLFQPGLVGEQAPGLSVRFTGINPVSYTHLDVYKRQAYRDGDVQRSVVQVQIVGEMPDRGLRRRNRFVFADIAWS